jgi:hypothetical protein
MTATYNLFVRQGQDFSLQVRWSEDGEVVDLTEWSGLMQIRAGSAAGAVIFEESGPAMDAESTFVVDIPASVSSAWAVSSMFPTVQIAGTTWVDLGAYDVEIVSPGGQTIRLVEGRVMLSPEVSR